MNRTNRLTCACLALTLLLPGVSGCGLFAGLFAGLFPARYTDNGGLDFLTLGDRVANGQFTELTPDELQFVADFVRTSLETAGLPAAPEMTDDQAAAVANFLDVNNLSSFEAIEMFVMTAAEDPSSIQGLEELAAAYAGTYDIDEGNLEHLDDILNGIIGLPSEGHGDDAM